MGPEISNVIVCLFAAWFRKKQPAKYQKSLETTAMGGCRLLTAQSHQH